MRFALTRPWALLAFAALCLTGAGALPRASSQGQVLPGREEDGDPFLRNFTAKEYGAFYQNWCVVQDSRGLIYVGNNSGVLEYDGVRWRLIRTEKGTLVRSLAVDASGRVYVGAKGEFGYLSPDDQGEMRFVSLLDRLSPADRIISDVFSISFLGNSVCFQSYERLFCLTAGNPVRVWRPAKVFQFACVVREHLYVQDAGRGLLVLEGEALNPVHGGERFTEEKVRAILPWALPGGREGLLIATQEQGLFIHDGRSAKPFPTPSDTLLREGQIAHVLPLGDGTLGIATLQSGLLHLSREGRCLGRVGKEEGLSSDSVKHLFQDSHSGLWMALQKGISRVELPSPISRFGEPRGLPGTVLSIHRHQGILHVGTDQGLFRLDPQGLRFLPVPGFKGAVWGFISWGESLLAAGSEGVFEVRAGRTLPVRKSLVATYCLLRSLRDPDRLFLGLAGGLASCRRVGDRWVDEGLVSDLSLQVRSLLETEDGSLWVGTTAQGALRLTFPRGATRGTPRVERFGTDRGLPSLNHTYVHWLGGALRVSSHAGIYRFREDQGRFERDPALSGLFPEGARWVYALKEDCQGRIWMHSYDEARGLNESGAALPQPGGTYRWEGRPCIRFAGSWVEGILPEEDGRVWFGTSEGLVRLDPSMPKHYDQPFRTLLRSVRKGKGLPVFGGTRSGPPEAPQIPFAENRLRFEFAAPSLEGEGATAYQVFLEGNDTDWSAWSAEPFKDFTNLREGDYRFRVRARNAFGTLGSEAQFTFRILAPWYRTWWAVCLYVLGGLAVGRAYFRWRMAALRSRNQELEAKVEVRTHDLASRNAELEDMDGTVQAINREVALQPLLGAILQQSLRQFPQAEKGAVLIQSEEDGLFRVQAAAGYLEGSHRGIAFMESEIVARYTEGTELLGMGVFRVKNLQRAAGSQQMGDLPLPHSLLAMSLEFEGKVAGFLVLESFTDLEAFREADVEKLRRFREHAVTALGKARLFDRLDAATTQMRTINDQKNQFLGIVAHDLRNPLNSIVLAAQLLDGEEDLEEAWRIARLIQKEGMDMSILIGRLLDIAAIESGTVKAEPEGLDLGAMARHILHRHKDSAASKGITLELRVPGAAVMVWADAKFLKEVLDNLVSNAVKFSPRGTPVLLRVEALEGRARISVEDQGPGFTAEDKEKLFGRFARLSARPTGGEKSTGLGLSIVKHMVEAMGGRVWVESVPGQGATFRVELPSRGPRLDNGDPVEAQAGPGI